MPSDAQETPTDPPRRTNSQVSRSSSLRSDRILTSSGANRGGREETENEDDDIFATPKRSQKRRVDAVEPDDEEEENMEPGPSQRAHPSKRPHAANYQVKSLYFMTNSNTNRVHHTAASVLVLCTVR